MRMPMPHLAGGLGGDHPTVASRRHDEWLLSAITVIVPLAIAVAVAIAVPDPNFFLALGITVGMLGLVALAASARYEVTLTFLVLYFGLVDGVIKLETANQMVSSLRDLMIAAICAGAIVRMIVRRDEIELPPLSGWVIAFVLLVAVEAFNPNTHGILKVIGGFRQQLEWVPFFFLGYLLMRSKDRFRKLFLLLGAIALINGAVSAYPDPADPRPAQRLGAGLRRTDQRHRLRSRDGSTPTPPAKSGFVRPPWAPTLASAATSACSPCRACWRCWRSGGRGGAGRR